MKTYYKTISFFIFVAWFSAQSCFAEAGSLPPMPGAESEYKGHVKSQHETTGLVLPDEKEGEKHAESQSGPFVISLVKGSEEEYDEDRYFEQDDDKILINDPLEPVNRVFFHFNDKLYFWILKPAAQGYSAVVPEDVRIGVRNVFDNVTTPVRVVNNVLQLKMKSAGIEMLRFCANTVFGIGGLFDVAKTEFGLKTQEEDFGQTLGTWGFGQGFYLNLPVIGSSSFRDLIGFSGDFFLDPVNYITPGIDRFSVKAGDRLNRTSLFIGDYEDIKKDAIDPYSAFRDIYFQYRAKKVKE